MQRLLLLLVLSAVGYYLYSSGIFETYIVNGGNPKKGSVCEVAGPTGDGVLMASTVDLAKFEIDSHMGTRGEKMAAAHSLEQYVSAGDISRLDDHTKVKVQDIKRVFVQGAPFWIVAVEVKTGSNSGQNGWIKREELIDTPINKLYWDWRKVERKQ